MNKRKLGQLGVIEVLLVAAGVAVIAFATGRYHTTQALLPFLARDPEMARLAAAYGPARNSEHGEEWILRDVFGQKREGVFVDVGASDYKTFSNTYYLETALGWSGVAVEPQTKFAADYAKFRPRTQFVPLFVSDESNREALLYVPWNDQAASGVKPFADSYGRTSPTRVTTTTLDDVLSRAGISRVDFLSMDIELAEPAALKGFSIRQYQPGLVCIEAHDEIRQFILDYFARAGYVVVGQYLWADPENLWFRPLPGADPPRP